MGVNQTVKEYLSYPDGVKMEVSTNSGSTWIDAGIMADGFSATYQYDLTDKEFGNAADADKQAKNMSLAIAPSNLYSWDSEAMEAFSAGMITRTAVAGTLVSGATQVLSSGGFSLNTAYLLDGQNATGLVQTINSVTGSVDGALSSGTGYEMVQVAGGWAITLLSGVTLAQNVTIDYDYTPATGYEMTAGESSKVLDPYQIRLTHYTNDAFTTYDYRMEIFRVFPDAGGLVFNKGGALSDNDFDSWTVSITGELDSGLASGSQLFKVFQTA